MTCDIGDHRGELRRFLTSRRARLSSQHAGLGVFGDNRRVPGLRREEVAGIQQVLDAITEAPADVRNGRRDILASNKLARALYSDIHAEAVRPPNVARFTFLNAKARDFFIDWDRAASDIVSGLRIEAGRHPCDKPLADLVGELSTRSEEFRVRWASHNVRHHIAGTKRMHHPVVGAIELAYPSLVLPGGTGLNLNVFTAAPGSPAQEALRFLASWADNSSAVAEPSELPNAEPDAR